MLTIPTCCWLCQMPLHLPQHGICSVCLKALPSPPPVCPCCGLPASNSQTRCGGCLLHPPPWQRMILVSDYREPLRKQIHQLKFSQGTARAVMLARLILLTWLTARREYLLARPDLMLTVPLHHKRALKRGYNQLAPLAKWLSHWTTIPWQPAALIRRRAGKVQHQLVASARRRNLRGAFSLEIDVRGRHIVLLDDVVTTGSTVTELSRLLMRSGAARVDIWCLCRTL
ncbi:DNA utilization protein GntX [Erwinia sp. OLTSP20]|uniref:DNA utilization protein GntX n=1 Tax=unclassified Erwinia TaxID=2622719 RepID=UPI000C17DDBB|nr:MULTISPECIES: DNA utilization protein GntX [unclassified Erwinia]PIJ51187.1 DNA utilization protein GntX [Erwinia sp. OAMSP11]PIJ73939.1 DNA utilization protein GntX [Erwinia sp. OLSSP12]PIJ83947.1 DNA utilization protein GntX [Erwinia sp. OLCASP19]PIJ86477.1 DNA utilization protein GntX [Erwinia sp. OLMTSP26]PIJ87956.1 DNA utilization protein GntX [Erwinia sp. OLMDSP33]